MQIRLLLYVDPHLDREDTESLMRELGKDIDQYFIEVIKAYGEVLDGSEGSSREVQRRVKLPLRTKRNKVSIKASNSTKRSKGRGTRKSKG